MAYRLVLKQGTMSLKEMNDVMQVLHDAIDKAFQDQAVDVRAFTFAHVAIALGAFRELKASDPKILAHALVDTVDLEQLEPGHPELHEKRGTTDKQ